MLGVYILVVSLLACAIVGSLVMTRGLRDRTTVVYGLLTASLAIVCIMNSLAVMMKQDQLLYVRGVMGSTTVAMYLIYVLIMEIKERKVPVRYLKTKLFYATIVMFIVDFTDLLFTGVIPGEPPKPIPNFGIIFFFGLYIVTLVIGIRQLRNDMATTMSIAERRRYAWLITGIVPIIFLAPLTSFILPNYFDISQFVVVTPLYACIFVMFVGYAIVRHGLFDIRLAAVRSLAYVLSLFVLAAVYYFIAYVMSVIFFKGQTSATVSLSPVNVVIATLLAFIFQPIKHFFDQVTDKVFFRDRYKTDDFYASINDVVTSTTDLRGLLQHTAMEIGGTLKSSQAFFFVRYNHTHYVSAGTPDHALMTDREVALIDDYLQGSEAIFLTEGLDGRSSIHSLLAKRRIGLVVPLMRHAMVIGYLFLGDQQGSRYTRRDIHVLHTIRNELVIAIQNALSLHEVREINATLQQRIDAATKELRASNLELRKLDEVKDEFVSMASHQLRTPLTSVKGYVSMVLEGDAGKITPQQHKLLSEAFNSSERMVHLIADFLSVSRLQTGKFVIDKTMNDLSAVVRQEIDALKLIAKAHDLRLEYFPSYRHLPQMAFDDAKVRQVIMNFIDNAIYYSRKDSKITVRLEKDGEMAIFTVTDTGIGVPEHEQAKLFNKFFRAQNARRQRPDGTGVGLFLAKKIITAHGGEMIFHSTEGEGSTFGFRMPIVTKLDEEVV